VLKILLTFALRQEGFSFERRLRRRKTKSGLVVGDLDAQEVAVFWLGIGVRHEVGFETLLSDCPFDLVINSGFAGAVRTSLVPGDFVLSENFSSPKWQNWLKTTDVFEARGRFACVDAIADSGAKMRIAREGDVVALDMESGRVAAVCRKLSVPLISARMISDRADEGIPGVFLGKGVRRIGDISEAITFARRMIVLRRRLADRLVGLIRAINAKGEEGDEPQISQITQI
jgi:nucleoside phosphorylase